MVYKLLTDGISGQFHLMTERKNRKKNDVDSIIRVYRDSCEDIKLLYTRI